MRFRIRHLTRYTYSAPVRLGVHRLRLRPRADAAAELRHFSLAIDPPPAGRSQIFDADRNLVTGVWFSAETTRLSVESEFEVCTARRDVEPSSAPMPWTVLYPPALRRQLLRWLAQESVAPPVLDFGAEVRAGTHDAAQFLHRLNARLHQQIERRIRLAGAPQSPEETLRLRSGACRDLAVLFAAVCRGQGLAARFVSGYQARSSSGGASRAMHAWPEVYLADAGWRGFDPTRGTMVADAHVALAAAAHPDDAAPLSGHYVGAAESSLHAEVCIDVDD